MLIYPKVKAENCIFVEQYINTQYIDDNSVTLFNTPTVDKGMILNGTTQYAALADEYKYSFGNGYVDVPFSVEAEVVMTDATSFTILSKGVYNTDDEWRLATGADDKIYWQLFDESVADCYIGRAYSVPLTANEGQKLHIVATYDGSGTSAGCKIYINGVPVDDTDADNNAGSYVAMEKQAHAVQIGRDDALYANGLFIETSIFDKELDPGEVADRFTTVTFREVDVLQLEYFLPLRTHYNNGVSELTHNVGIVDGDVIKWGDGSVVATFPSLLANNGVNLNGSQYIGTSTGGTFPNGVISCFGGLFRYSETSDKILYDFRNASAQGIGLQAKTTGLYLFRDNLLEGATSVKNCNDGMWHSVFCVVVPVLGGNMDYSIYIDGVIDVENTTTAFTTAIDSKFYIGCDYATNNKFVGSVKFPFLWHILLTPTQAKWQHENLFRQFNI